MQGSRLTQELFKKWTTDALEPVELHRGSPLVKMNLPSEGTEDLGILSLPIAKLAVSNAYPYGLTEAKIAVMDEAGIKTVGELASTSDNILLSLDGVGPSNLRRIRNVVGQAIWM